MSWLKQSQNEVTVDMESVIKQKMLESKAILALFDQFEVDPARLQDLRIVVDNLDKKYAETDGEQMTLNTFLFDGGSADFFEKYFFIVAHEIVHWLSRVREQDAYFNDPEEVLGFVSSVAYELEKGSGFDAIYNKIYPKIEWHFNDPEDALTFFKNMYDKAKELLTD